MRIIAGKHRGRTILGPEGDRVTRPITDRVKTSLFDRLDAAGQIAEARVLDLFAGTGSMGLESLSRGAAQVIFVERDRSALNRLKQNLATLKEEAAARVVNLDALGPAVMDLAREPFTLVFCDPPYKMMEEPGPRERVQKQIERLAGACAEGAVLVLRTPERIEASAVPGWSGPTTYDYGSMRVHLYERPST